MTLVNWVNEGTKKLTWVDIGLTKLAVFAATLLVAKFWLPILNLDWYWYLVVFVLASIKPMTRFFTKN